MPSIGDRATKISNTNLMVGNDIVDSSNPIPVYLDKDADSISIVSSYTTKTVTIAESGSLSTEVDIEGYKYVGLSMPAAWTAANLTIWSAKTSGGTYQQLQDDEGVITEIKGVAASVDIGIDVLAGTLASKQYLKLQSCTVNDPETPITQVSQRTITVTLKG